MNHCKWLKKKDPNLEELACLTLRHDVVNLETDL